MLDALSSTWSRPYKIVRVLQALGMEVPQRLRRERFALLVEALATSGIDATLADGSPIDLDESPGIEAKIRLRLSSGTVLPDRVLGYEVVARMPGSGMSECFKVRAQDGEFRFLKRVPINGEHEDALRRELEIYQKLESAQAKHVLRVIDHLRTPEGIALITEFAEGGTLDEYREQSIQLSEDEVKSIALALLSGLGELHSLGIVHRDLKPANVLRVGTEWKLADFGISKNLVRLRSREVTFQRSGTPGYAAPEQMAGREAHPSADIYAFGKILVRLLTGQTDIDFLYEFPRWVRLIRACVVFEPDARLSLDEVAARLRDL